MTRLVLWRHGQTDYNAGMRVQGRIDIPLNAAGLEQARAAAPGLAALDPVRVVSSPLTRARQTAQELAELTGRQIEFDEGLLERSFGRWEGLSRSEMEASWPEEFAAWRVGEDPIGVGVETRAATSARVGAALRRIVRDTEASAEQTIVVVSHGSAITLGVSHLLELDCEAWFGLRSMDNCRHAVVAPGERKPGWMLAEWNVR
ncbi:MULTISPECIES: histidine phosphatase family protein [unclassified Actinomyces]|uniref:histidine phosphatase family protein n=1 Tax=unclassified Actinomyces TaxID=2609248 RepID=UPI00137441B3|nr:MULTISPECIES: histidine phosphatase family protein [unclassified Actinomyces]MBW3069914.1 histidine phosphatase family protein [Actinomyces sp. 594]NDR54015.1 histidine phosphatase family protein [Actinomyces sp. 565]QHO90660.1 histidine phosphatase family protein [Actinomyces sp. 432]